MKSPLSSQKDAETAGQVLVFEGFALDLPRRCLMRGSEEIHLHPRAFDTLACFVRHAGQLLSKDELFEAVWKDTVVSDNNLSQCIRELREALGDSVQQPRFIRTVPRRGYIFLPEVVSKFPEKKTVAEPDPPPAEPESEPAPAVLPAPHRQPPSRRRWLAMAAAAAVLLAAGVYALQRWQAGRSTALNPVAVLSFQVAGDNAHSLNWLQHGLADLVTTDLAQDPQLQVISRSRILEQVGTKSDRVNPENLSLARAVGARTAVTGVLVKAGDTFEFDVQVARVKDGDVIASLRTTGAGESGVLDAIAGACSQLRVLLAHQPSPPQAATLPTHSLAAYQHYLLGLDDSADGSRQSLADAVAEFRKALALDPDFVLAALHLRQVLDQQRFWGFPVSGQPVTLASSTATSPAVRMLIHARTLAPAERAATLRMMTDQYADFSLEEGIPIDLVYALWESGQPQTAIQIGERYATDPDMAAFYRANLDDELGRVFESLGEYQNAISAIKAAETLRPGKQGEGYLQHRYWLGRMESAAGQTREALAIYDELQPQIRAAHNGRLLSDLAWGYYFAGQRALAQRLVREALQWQPQWWNAWHLRAWLDMAAGNDDLAASEFQRAFQLSPEHDLPSLYFSAVAQRLAGHAAEAHTIFLQLLTSIQNGSWGTSSEPEVDAAARAGEMALVEAQLQQTGQARTALSTLLQQPNSSPEQDYICAQAYAVLGDAPAAAATLRRALAAGYRGYQHILDNPSFHGVLSARQLHDLIKTAPSAPPEIAQGT